MRTVSGWSLLTLLVACAPGGPRHLDDPGAELEAPVVGAVDGLGRVLFSQGIEARSTLDRGTVNLVQEGVALGCEGIGSGRSIDLFLAFSMADRDTERGAWDTRGGQPLAVHATLDDGETLSVEATDGWVRIDERTGETVRGALSWVAADDDGERLGWGEGAFEVVVCEAWRG